MIRSNTERYIHRAVVFTCFFYYCINSTKQKTKNGQTGNNLENLEKQVEPNVERSDMYSGMMALLAFAKLQKNDKAAARKNFNQAKDMGLTKGHMARIIGRGKPVDDFFMSMEPVGKLDP